MKKRFFKGNFFLKFLCAKFFALICVLTLSVGTVKATDWMSIASTPTTGDFYIYNLYKGMFVSYNQWNDQILLTSDPNEVTLFSLNVGEEYSTISFSSVDYDAWNEELQDFEKVTKYLSMSSGYIVPSTDPYNVKIEASENVTGASRIWIYKSDLETYYLSVYNNNLEINDLQCSGLSTGIGTDWIFITEENFSTLEPPHHYAQIQYPGDGDKHGAYATIVDYDANWNPIYEYHYTLPNTDLEVVNFKESYTHQFNEVQAMPARDYQFNSWDLTGANAEYSVNPYSDVTYTATTNPTQINVTSTSDDAESPEVAIIKPTFEALAPLNMTLRKAANRGSVAVQYQNYFDNDAHDGLEYKTINCDGLTSANTEKSYTVYSSDVVTVTAQPALGYNFYGWYSVNSTTGAKTLVTTEAEFTFQPNGNEIYYAYFDTPITAADKFQVGMSLCQTIEQALAAVNETDKLILQVNDYTIDGNYTIPAGVTLLIPYSENQKSPKPIVDREVNKADGIPAEPHLTLTLASGATLNVNGTIEVGGLQFIGGNAATDGYTKGTGRPGAYSQLIMSDNSSIILNNGAKLRAWGYITGSGSIDARRGSEVREQFQVMDWKGGSNALAMQDNPQKVFPVNQYFIQNVEVPTKYRPGARLFTSMSVCNEGGTMVGASDNVQIIGIGNRNDGEDDDIAMFLMDDADDSEDTWVRKSYEVANDKQIYDINNSAYLNGITIDLPAFGFTFTSSNYDLPITNNMKIHLLSGEMKITQDVVLLPGSEMQIDKKSTVTINAGKSLYLYDLAQWGNYAYPNATERKVPFRPGGVQNRPALADAVLNVRGTFEVEGALYTTAGGANIYSTIADAGTVKFKTNAGAGKNVYQWKNSGDKYFAAACTSSQLKNDVGSAEPFTPTAGTTIEEDPISFCFIDFDGDDKGEWKSLSTDGCVVKDESDVYYIKPKEYVAISQGSAPVAETDHTYRDHYAGTDRIFILAADGNCQWWEVAPVAGHPDLFECINDDNHTYYYYDARPAVDAWVEKKFKVSWVNWDGSPINYQSAEEEAMVNYYHVAYGTVPQWLGANPTRDHDASHEYTFDGWMPTPAAVTKDVTYMAQFKERDRMYAITFNDENDELIELTYCKLGEMPACSRHALASNEEWAPALGAVTGNQVYTLQAKNVDGPFTIRFVNWNGEELLAYDQEEGENAKIIAGSTPAYNGATPIKPADNSHAYTFVGWTPSIGPATQNMTYTAKFEVQQLTGLNVVDAQTITSDLVIPDVRISTTGSLNVTGSLTADNFYLESNGSSASGQIVGGEGNITADHIYFDFKVNAKNHKWYGVAVPWQVDATSGISVNGKTLVLGKDFDIIYYDGARRAAEGKKKCWKYVENDGDKTLQPGRLYMIGLMMDAPTIRFAKKANASLLTTSTSVTAHPQTTGDVTDANWNGVANPALFHAFVNPGVIAAQVYNPESNGYDPIEMDDAKFVVGQGAFVQAPADKSIVVTTSDSYPVSAPRRAKAEANTLYDVRIAPAEAEYTDRLFVRVEDEKEADKYVIGKDLAKLGVSKSVAQMWINRYNTELCLNTMTMENGVAEYPLSIFAPKAGEYTITNEQSSMSNEYTLYLTFNGEAIWNLSDAAYTGTFDAGTTSAYGLRISARAPQIGTGIDEAVVDAKGETRKVLIDNQVFIIRGENVYSVDGQLVK